MAITKANLISLLGGTVLGLIIGVQLPHMTSAATQPAAPAQAPATTTNTGNQGNDGQLPPGHPAINNDSLKAEIAAEEEALKKDPENLQIIIALGNLNFDAKEYQTASKYYERALAKDPKNVGLSTDLGTCYLSLNQVDQAIARYNESLAIDPHHFQTLLNLGVAKMTLGDKKGAAETWQKVVQLYPDNPQVPMIKDAISKLMTE